MMTDDDIEQLRATRLIDPEFQAEFDHVALGFSHLGATLAKSDRGLVVFLYSGQTIHVEKVSAMTVLGLWNTVENVLDSLDAGPP